MELHPGVRLGWLLVVAGVVLGVSLTARTGMAQIPAAPQTPPKEGATLAQQEEELAREGEALVNRVCDTSCHGLEKLDEMRRTPGQWNDSVISMAGRGALATEPQFAIIKKYLARYYGMVAVNTATAADLSAVLGLSAKDAAAIVEYRTSHGKYADVEAVLKVPGIDKSKIEEQPDALRFN